MGNAELSTVPAIAGTSKLAFMAALIFPKTWAAVSPFATANSTAMPPI
jgi:hypothetical protein